MAKQIKPILPKGFKPAVPDIPGETKEEYLERVRQWALQKDRDKGKYRDAGDFIFPFREADGVPWTYYTVGTVFKINDEMIDNLEWLYPNMNSGKSNFEELQKNKKLPYIMYIGEDGKGNSKFTVYMQYRNYFDEADAEVTDIPAHQIHYKTVYWEGIVVPKLQTPIYKRGNMHVVHPVIATKNGKVIKPINPSEVKWKSDEEIDKILFKEFSKEYDNRVRAQKREARAEKLAETIPIDFKRIPYFWIALAIAIVLMIGSLIFKSWPVAWFGIVFGFCTFVSAGIKKLRGNKKKE